MSTFYDWDGEYAVGGDWEDVGSPVIIGYIDVWVNDDGYTLPKIKYVCIKLTFLLFF